ncbi:MAG: SpoVR family protein [Phycisphaerales bacterium]|nr:MAG: SpoVR family protein [Phycisphaerales bacterium]
MTLPSGHLRKAAGRGAPVPHLTTDLSPELREHMLRIKARAIDYGLDFHEVVFEVLSFDTMNQIAAYGGFPVRYPHWRWGMAYEDLSKRDAYGMGRIYEMVINNDPCYAYLQESNSLTDQKLVMAHVYAHADFFKHNLWFSKTDRKMMDQMANHATRVHRHIERQGAETVERFLDDCLAIEHLIDPHSPFMQRTPSRIERAPRDSAHRDKLPAKDYMDPFINPPAALARERSAAHEEAQRQKARFPSEPTRDVLAFLLRHAPLEDWQADVLGIIRDEAYYYAPQAQTKVMNEGWATYWHSKLMTEHFLEASEIIDYAEQHAGVVFMPPGGFNPYKIGVELWKDIERRWDRGQHGPDWDRLDDLGAKARYDDASMLGRKKMFEIRSIYNDVSFIDEFLTPEFVERHKMYQYRHDPHTGQLRVVSRDFDRIKQTLLYRLTNMGQPFIHVVDANYRNRGELVLQHQWTGLEVDAAKAVEVLRALRRLWGRPVHLLAQVTEDMVLLTIDDPTQDPKRQNANENMAVPAHSV